MAHTLVVRGVRFYGRTLRVTASFVSEGLQQYSSIPENEVCITAVTETKIRKAAVGKKSISEKILAVIDKIHDRRLPPELRRGACSSGIVDPSRVEADIVNVAEQRILRSMMNGDFENLSGKGRPLKFETNPHADPAEDMAYRILAKNGFAPEWVELNKEIRVLIQRWRAALASAYQTHLKRQLVIDREEEYETVSLAWKDLLTQFDMDLKAINRKVLKYNLLVPFGRQIMSYKLEKELLVLEELEKSTAQGF